MRKLIYLFIAISFIIASCGKKEEAVKETSAPQQSMKSDGQKEKADSLKAVNEQNEREQKVKDALDEEKILKDTLGYRAVNAEASSAYNDNTKEEQWSAEQMIGVPDVETYGDNGKAWAPREQNKGVEWIKLTFEKAINAEEVRIRQSFNPGAIIRVELLDLNGKSHVVWEGIDKTEYEPGKIRYFSVKFDRTDYKTRTVRITLATNSVPGWNEIDAVQLVGK